MKWLLIGLLLASSAAHASLSVRVDVVQVCVRLAELQPEESQDFLSQCIRTMLEHDQDTLNTVVRKFEF